MSVVRLSLLLVDDVDQVTKLEADGEFSTMVRGGVDRWPLHQVALLIEADDSALWIRGFGLLDRSLNKQATGWHRLSYSERSPDGFEPLALDELVGALEPRLRKRVADQGSRGGVLPSKSGEATAEVFATLRPESSESFRRLFGPVGGSRSRLRGDALQAAAHEADATRLALDIADIPRRAMMGSRPDGEAPFLQRVGELRVPEDAAIVHDSMRFLDFERVDHPAAVAQFSNGFDRLTVMNVNRQPLEHTTGADLIYYNHAVEGFVLVQYKTMRREDRPKPLAGTRLIYRPDGQLEKELTRMRAIETADDLVGIGAYRLHAGWGFLKLCKPVAGLDYPPRDLVSGMYLPLDYYDTVLDSPEVKGPRDGVILGYETVPRHIANDLFVGLVQGGWIGSRGVSTEVISDLVVQGLSADRSVTVAARHKSKQFKREGRR